ncbi:hypothetical protein GCM10009647_026680 [Streptomyces sanglieri]
MIRNGTPANGPLSDSFARARAISCIGRTIALSLPSTVSAREMATSSSSSGETSRRATNSARPTASWALYSVYRIVKASMPFAVGARLRARDSASHPVPRAA